MKFTKREHTQLKKHFLFVEIDCLYSSLDLAKELINDEGLLEHFRRIINEVMKYRVKTGEFKMATFV